MKVVEGALLSFGAIHEIVRVLLTIIYHFLFFRFLSVRLVSNVPHPEKYVFVSTPSFTVVLSLEVYICEI